MTATTDPRVTPTDHIELAWAAGFFDGEGCVGFVSTGSAGRGRPEVRIQVRQSAAPNGGRPETLERFLRAVRVGQIGGPYIDRPTRRGYSPNRRPVYSYVARRRADVISVMAALWPYLGSAKRGDAASAGVAA